MRNVFVFAILFLFSCDKSCQPSIGKNGKKADNTAFDQEKQLVDAQIVFTRSRKQTQFLHAHSNTFIYYVEIRNLTNNCLILPKGGVYKIEINDKLNDIFLKEDNIIIEKIPRWLKL
jgi:hypothetical protein